MKLRRVLHLLVLVPVVCVVVTLVSLPASLAGASGDSTGTRVLYPPAGAVATSDLVLVMILGPDTPEPPAFRVDGGPLDLQKMPFAEAWKAVPEKIAVPAGTDDLPMKSPLLADKDGKAVWVATVELPEGEHTVTLDGVALTRFTSRPPREADALATEEPVLRVHASPASRDEALDCTGCHQTGAPGEALGVALTPKSCHSCHEDVNLSLSHEHVMEFLATCQMCHDPHASTRPSLLIDTRETVCGLCHESGYAR